MDFPSQTMHDTFKDEIWKELGPLDPEWFDTLTAQALTNEGNVSDQDDLCANQEGHFKTPLNKTAVDSQLFSTPKLFRHIVSPETENEHSITEKETSSWKATQSPYFIQMSKEGMKYGGVKHHNQDSFDLLQTPQKSPASHAKHISESLGVQSLPDISWTSSLNTPPPLPSTLILTKHDESPCPVSVSADDNVTFVRKLFPSLSNASRVGMMSPESNDTPSIHQGVVSPVAGQNPESLDSPQRSLNHGDCVLTQKPDATEDGEICSTVASDLDGAEDVLAIFFTNSSLALRKVKTERIKRKHICPAQEHSCSSTDTCTDASSEQRAADQEPGTLSSPPPVKTGDIGITQWSPLSLSEIPPCTVDTFVHDDSSSTQVNDDDSGQEVRPRVKITHSGFTKKTRKFVYKVETSKRQVGGDDSPSDKMDLSSGQECSENQMERTPAEAGCCSSQKNEVKQHRDVTEEHLPPPVRDKLLDLDMSQLSRDFAQDFSQMPDIDKVAQGTLRNGFSPSACLSAMKRANQRARQANLPNSDAVSSRGSVSTPNQNNLTIEGTTSDSGFQSAVADSRHVTTSSHALAGSEYNGQSQQWTGFKTEIHRTTCLTSTNSENGRAHLEDILREDEPDVKPSSAIKAKQTLGPGRERGLYMKSTSTPQLPSRAKGTVDNISYITPNGQSHRRLPEKTTESLPSVHASGFKTASNKGIRVSSANLERAKRLFEETQGEKTFADQPVASGSVKLDSNQPLSASEKIADNSCQLTASQRADVTELCTLLEEADSQFEFTQFKTATLKHHCQHTPQKVDKEHDPDLSGIDFDDSFNSDAGKHLTAAATYDKVTSESSGLSAWSAMKAENSSAADASSSKQTPEGSGDTMSAQTKDLDGADHVESNNLEKVNPLTLGAGFKTARGNVLRVSKKCLSKARALFADLGENLVTSEKAPYKRSSDTDAKTQHTRSVDDHTGNVRHHKEDTGKLICSDRRPTYTGDEDATERFNDCKTNTAARQSGFLMASGKRISISAKAMREADCLFKDCDLTGSDTVVPVKKSIDPLSGIVSHKKNSQKSENVEGMKRNVSEGPVGEFDIVNARPAIHHAEDSGNPCFTPKPFSSLSSTPARTIDSTAVVELSNRDGFCTTSGEKTFVSADAIEKTEDIHTLEDTNKQLQQKGDALRTDHPACQVQVLPPKHCGFQTASGKGVTVSSAALKKAKSLLGEFNDAESKICVNPPPSWLKMPDPGLPPRNHGLLAASGKPACSSDAFQMEKAPLGDSSFSADGAAASHTRSSDREKDNAENTEKIYCGFSTAQGAKVLVSQTNHLKAKKLLKEVDDGSLSAKAMQEADSLSKDSDLVDSNDGMSIKQRKGVAPLSGSGSDKKNLSNFQRNQRVTGISEERGHAELKRGTVGPLVNYEDILLSKDVEVHAGASKNTLDSSNSDFSSCGGFCTASGKKVYIPDDAIIKAKSLLNENATFEDTNQRLKQKVDATPLNSGFQTASGKGLTISSVALTKAKTLLSECEGAEDKINVRQTHVKTPVPCPPHRNHGFLSASGKPVACSSKALQKAKALFSDIGSSAEVDAGSRAMNGEHGDVRNEPESIRCGTEKTLVSAKNPVKDFADENDSNSCSTDPHDSPKSHVAKVKDVRRVSRSNVTTASDKDITIKESSLQEGKSFLSLQETDHEKESRQIITGSVFVRDDAPTDAFKYTEREMSPSVVNELQDSPVEEMSSALDFDVNQTSRSERSEVNGTEESSFLCFETLNLSGCTETQQRFLAQEALDCTKALLEDEDGQRLSMASEHMPLRDKPTSDDGPIEERKGKGKRLVEDDDMSSPPPLKRRLLEEFDRTVDGRGGSALRPETSSPNGVMKDRRVFRYSVSLHPNITGPHRNGRNCLEARSPKTAPTQHSTPGDGRAAHSKMPTFVPPFLKSAKTESHKNTVLKDNMKTSAFVPPFKKQRTAVKESSSTPQEKEDTLHHLFATPFNGNTYTPPSIKTQSAADGTGNKSKESSQVAAMTDITNNNLMINQNLPVSCGSEDSAAEGLCVMNTFPRGQDMFQGLPNIELARDMQDMRIRKKRRQTIRPFPGSLFLTKTSGVTRIALKAAVNGQPPARYTPKQLYSHGVHQHVCDITSESAESFRFNLQQFFKPEAFTDGGGVQLADGGWLIPANDWTAGKEEFYRSLCDTPGVDPKLISEEWVYNHYRWIVWKQASMERSFPETMGSLCLNPEQVLLQLKYRYDVEVDHSRRPALRKIMEKDDTAAKTLVLCVCGVITWGHPPKKHAFGDVKTPGPGADVENTSAVVWLTDGWYAIKAQLDEPLTAMLHKGRLAVGGKLIVHGAQLVGSQDACSPLEAPESLMLKICANSSRPTRWHCKMGFHRDPRPFLLPISSLYSNGGPVGCVDIIILRSYPIQWMERKSDGGVVFRCARAEEREARQYDSHKERAMEVLFGKIQAEFEKEEKANDKPQRSTRRISRQYIASLRDGEELHEAVGDDSAYLEAHLSERQMESLCAYRRSLMEKKQAELQERYRQALENAEDGEGSRLNRDVTPVWRLCIADALGRPGNVYQLNVWRPPSDLQTLLKEGHRYRVYNLSTSDVRKHGGSTNVQLTATKKTQFQELQASQEWLSTRFQPRASTRFRDLQNPRFQPLCEEVDLTGCVISVINEQGFSPAFYLADGELNFIKVRCFTSLAQSGLEDVVKPRAPLALSNLQLRGQSTTPTPVVYAGDLTVLSSNPKEAHLQESLSRLRSLFQGQDNLFVTAEAKLSHLIKSDGLSATSSPALQKITPSTGNGRQDAKTNVVSHQSVRSLGSFTPVSRKPSATNCSTEKEPSSLKRKRALDYLSRIPSPPPLSPLTSVTSLGVKKTFVPPRRSGTPGALRAAQTPARTSVKEVVEDEWVNDEELAMIDTQALIV